MQRKKITVFNWRKPPIARARLRVLDPVRWQRAMRGHEPDPLGEAPSSVTIIEGRGRGKRLTRTANRKRRTSRKGNGLNDFLGILPGKEDALAIQKEMRRERQ